MCEAKYCCDSLQPTVTARARSSKSDDFHLCGILKPIFVVQSDMDMVSLPTLLDGANITIMTDDINSTEVVTVMSFASEATVVTPAAFACNVSQLLSSLCSCTCC